MEYYGILILLVLFLLVVINMAVTAWRRGPGKPDDLPPPPQPPR